MRFPKVLLPVAAILVAGGTLGGVVSSAMSATTTYACTSSTGGSCGPYSTGIFPGGNGTQATIVQDIFQSTLTQTLSANSAQDWSVTSTAPAGNGAVLGYPNAQATYTVCLGSPCQSEAEPLADFGDLTSQYANNAPSGTGFDYEWAYDIWLTAAGPAGGNPWNGDQEIMIWTDNHGQTPAGNDTHTKYTAADGSTYEVWTWAGANTLSAQQTVTFVKDAHSDSGTMDLSGFFSYLVSSGLDHSSTGIGVDQIDFGYEVCSTNGQPATFTVSNYNLVANLGGPTPTPTPTTPTPTPTATTPTPTPTPTATTPTPTPTPTTGVPGSLSAKPLLLEDFAWAAVSGATGYEFQLQEGGVTIADDTVTSTSTGNIQVSPATAYKWRVRVKAGTWSAWTSLTTP
jgi:hypothetical protein